MIIIIMISRYLKLNVLIAVYEPYLNWTILETMFGRIISSFLLVIMIFKSTNGISNGLVLNQVKNKNIEYIEATFFSV